MRVREVHIPKGNGKTRTIFVIEDPELKTRLKRIGKIINRIGHPSTIMDAINLVRFLGGKDVPTHKFFENGSEPLSEYRIYEADIHDCFHSIPVEGNPKSDYAKRVLAKILENYKLNLEECFLEYRGKKIIPQGFPSSPAISNFYLKILVDSPIRNLLRINFVIYAGFFQYFRYFDNIYLIFKRIPDLKINDSLRAATAIVYSAGLSFSKKFTEADDIIGVKISKELRPAEGIVHRMVKKFIETDNESVRRGVASYLFQFKQDVEFADFKKEVYDYLKEARNANISATE